MTDKRIPIAVIRAVWLDSSLTAKQAGEKIGMSRNSLSKRAKALGLPKRRVGHPARLEGPVFIAMWNAGCSSHAIAQHFKCHRLSVCQAARRLREAGEPIIPRSAGGNRPGMTLAQFKEMLLSKAMARAAVAEQSAIIGAKMADQISKTPGSYTGARMIRAAGAA